VEELVEARRDVATNEAKQCVEDDDDSTKGAAVAWGEESEERECYTEISKILNPRESPELTNRQASHHEELCTIADYNSQK
jgi:hypothetical protein